VVDVGDDSDVAKRTAHENPRKFNILAVSDL